MTLETADRKYAEVLLTYVTESPAWKPSYRVVVGTNNKVMLEGWAIVDNVSGEDWKGVLVGVGASSALSFRYDLWSVRRIDRDLLAGRRAVRGRAADRRLAVRGDQRRRGAGVARRRRGAQREGAAAIATACRSPAVEPGEPVLRRWREHDGHDDSPTPRRRSTSSLPPAIASGVRGVVTDKKTGEKLVGVTVVATKKGGKETLTAITDEQRRVRARRARPGPMTWRSTTATSRSSARASTSRTTS